MSSYIVTVNGQSYSVTATKRQGTTLTFLVDGQEYSVSVAPRPTAAATTSSHALPAALQQQPAATVRTTTSSSPDLLAPIPGIVSELKVLEGQQITLGETVVVLEAMKMENPIKAHRSGKVSRIYVKRGDEIAHGAALVSIEE